MKNKKFLILAFILVVTGVALFVVTRAVLEHENPALNVTWDGPYALKVPDSSIVLDSRGSKSLVIQPKFADVYSHFQTTLFRISNPPLRYRFALEGTISYTNLPDDCSLDLLATYEVQTLEAATTDDAEDGRRRPSGTSESRPFILTIPALPGNGKLLQLDLSVFLGGHPVEDPRSKGLPPSLTLSALRLVAFPDPTSEETGLVPYSPSPRGLDWKSFCAGVAATALFSLALAQAILLVRRLRKLRDEGELRRIASLDG